MSESEWFNQKQENSITTRNSARKNHNVHENDRQSMSGTLLGTCQNVSYSPK